mmetsp:Transcript_99474/g.171247  ORF Transcript_99474/g.171247 Transcript_99474/m.171247 type:complete len:85 (-) Transcript_99474:5-259(-)
MCLASTKKEAGQKHLSLFTCVAIPICTMVPPSCHNCRQFSRFTASRSMLCQSAEWFIVSIQQLDSLHIIDADYAAAVLPSCFST